MAMNAMERSNHGANNSRKSKVKRPSAGEREPIASVEERDVVENRLERSLLVWLVLADLANGTAIAALVFFMFPTPVVAISGATLSQTDGLVQWHGCDM